MIKSFSSHSLRFQLTVLVLLVVVPGLLSVSWLTHSLGKNWMRQMDKHNKEIRAKQLAEKLATYSTQTVQILENVTQMPEIGSMSRSQQEPILRFLVNSYGFNIAQTFDMQGQEVASTSERQAGKVNTQAWFQMAIEGEGRMAGLIEPKQQQPVLCVAVPIALPPPRETTVGVIRTCIDLVTLASRLETLRWGKTGYAMLMNRQGYVLIHPEVSWLSQSQLVNWRDRPEIQPALTGTPSYFEAEDRQGRRWLSYALPMEDGLIWLLQEQAQELSQAEGQFLVISIAFTVGTAIIIGMSVWWIAREFTRPITDLIVAATTLCQGELTSRITVNRDDEIGILLDSFNRMADQLQRSFRQLAIANQTLEEKVTQRTRELEAANKALYAANTALNCELEKGRQIQRNFLPKRDEAKPVIILNPPDWEIWGWFKPARQVAGDFYDAFDLGDGYIGLVIADICDKGVGAALFMPLIQSLMRIFSGQTTLKGLVLTGKFRSPERPSQGEEAETYTPYQLNALKAVDLTNNYLAKNHRNLGMFATLFFGVLDQKTGDLVYINGGHLPLFLIDRRGGVKDSLPPTGAAVGLSENTEYKSKKITIEPGDLLLGYTDGVTDARSPEGEAFSLEKLLSILEQPPTSATVLLERISTQVNYHRGCSDQFDDMTLIVVRRSPLSAPSP